MHEVKLLRVRSLHATTIALCGLLFGSSRLFAAEDAEKPEEKSVADLLAKLKSDDEAERTEARKALVLRGEAIKAEVQKALDGAGQDADYSAQLKQIVKDLGQNEMLRGFDAPQTIDLELKDATVKDALAKLKETFGFAVNASEGAAAKKLELNRKGLTFFEALDSIREAAKLGYRIDQSGQAAMENAKSVAISLEELGEKSWVAAAPAGPFLIVVQSVNSYGNKSIDMNGGGNEHRQMNMQVLAIPQPGLTLGGVQPDETKFTDSKGNTFNGQHQGRARNFGFRGQRIAGGSGPIYLNDGIQLGGEVAPPLSWEASVKVQIPLKMISKTLDLAGGAGSVETSDGQVSVGKPEQSGAQWKLKVTFPQNSELMQGGWGGVGMAARINAKAGGAANAIDNKPPKEQAGYFVLNGEGNVIQSMGMSGHGNGRTMTYDLTFNEEPKSVLLQWNGERTERTVKFKVPNIPMP